ncbi:carbon-nitrogen hydrolase family protein [Solimicrobium silvestre]|uniref:Putative amidohydrolase n=1 Tax=Solimicrobium silvestre TaxID=2099400 RepID=A0A2S9H4E1_9BURK|nr:carbon-nitrogen hydrolase family protein [Solimicrobium silvestre]PRC94854.1 putative amidohydrolase [Solimicrobium silvestre]
MMKIAAIQMTSGPLLHDNINTATRLIDEAVAAGAKLVLLPEYWPVMGMHEQDKTRLAQSPDAALMTEFMAEQARSHGIYLIGGTIPCPSPEVDKVYNSSLVFDPQGHQVARYDKIHLFGFTKGAESYQESLSILAGTKPVSVEAKVGADTYKIGLSICYDLRFPELYRAFGACDLIVVPAAFTYTTGSVHWEVLLRARAIENQCYVLASGQVGRHPNGRHTWGHSMLIDPWGKIVSVLPDSEGVVAGELDTQLIQEVRRNLPALQHRMLA